MRRLCTYLLLLLPHRYAVALGTLSAVLFLLASPVRAANGVTAWLDRDAVALGENVILTLTFEGVAPGTAPTLPAIPNLRLLGVSTGRTEVNATAGRTSVQVSFHFTLTPTRVGEIAIPPMPFQIGQQNFRTDPLVLRVTPANPAASTARPNGAELRLTVPKTNIYLGEILPCEVTLYVEQARNLHNLVCLANGFTIGAWNQLPQRQVSSGTRVINVLPLRNYVTAAKTGSLVLGPASVVLDLPMPNNQAMGGFRWQRITLSSLNIPIHVMPLPAENVPSSFNGTVGSFQLSVSARPTNLNVGDPITLTIRLSGRGMLDTLTLPPQPQWRDFKTYAPNSSVQTSDPQRISGIKEFEQVIIPLNHEITAIPPVEFSYFDAEAKSYRTLTHNPIPVVVHPGLNVVGGQRLPGTNTAARGETSENELLHIRPQFDPNETAGRPLHERPWFLALQGAPLIAWAGLFALRKRRETRDRDPRGQRRRRVQQQLRLGLAELRQHAGAGETPEFFAVLFRLLQEQLGERLDLPASALTESVVHEHLARRGIAPELQRDVEELFRVCNQARYSRHSEHELAELLPKAEAVLTGLRSIRP